jgi:hypothetical protein
MLKFWQIMASLSRPLYKLGWQAPNRYMTVRYCALLMGNEIATLPVSVLPMQSEGAT